MYNQWVEPQGERERLKTRYCRRFVRWADKTEPSDIKGDMMLFFTLPSPDCCLPLF